jgi:stage V sporulation protein B
MMKKIANNSISCLLSVFMGIIIYIISILLFKVFDVNDVKNRLVRK